MNYFTLTIQKLFTKGNKYIAYPQKTYKRKADLRNYSLTRIFKYTFMIMAAT